MKSIFTSVIALAAISFTSASALAQFDPPTFDENQRPPSFEFDTCEIYVSPQADFSEKQIKALSKKGYIVKDSPESEFSFENPDAPVARLLLQVASYGMTSINGRQTASITYSISSNVKGLVIEYFRIKASDRKPEKVASKLIELMPACSAN